MRHRASAGARQAAILKLRLLREARAAYSFGSTNSAIEDCQIGRVIAQAFVQGYPFGIGAWVGIKPGYKVSVHTGKDVTGRTPIKGQLFF